MTTARSRNSPSRSAPAYLAATVVTGIIAGSVVGSALPQDQPAPRAAPLSVVEPVRPAPFRTPLALAPAGRTAAEPTKHLPHTAGPSAAVAVVPAVRAGGVEYTGGVLRRRHGDETLLQTIERCARAGVTVAPTRVECNG